MFSDYFSMRSLMAETMGWCSISGGGFHAFCFRNNRHMAMIPHNGSFDESNLNLITIVLSFIYDEMIATQWLFLTYTMNMGQVALCPGWQRSELPLEPGSWMRTCMTRNNNHWGWTRHEICSPDLRPPIEQCLGSSWEPMCSVQTLPYTCD